MPDLLDKLTGATVEKIEDINYTKEDNAVIERITSETGLSEKEIKEKISEKKQELKGLISIEGAIFLISKEFGVDIKESPEKSTSGISNTDQNPSDKGNEITSKEADSKGDGSKEAKDGNSERDIKELKESFVHEAEHSATLKSPVISVQKELKSAEPKSLGFTPPTLTPFKPMRKGTQPKITPQPIKEEYPLAIVEIKENDPLLAKLDATEQLRILGEINKLKFAVKSVLEKGTDYYGRLPTRSGCHKLQTIFNISTEIIEELYWKDEDGQWVAKYKVRAITPNGRYSEAMGLCEQNEKGRTRTLHDTLATAQTRATNRAILDLVGFGQVSDEEVRVKPKTSKTSGGKSLKELL